MPKRDANQLAADVRAALEDGRSGPLEEHDAMCFTFSGYPETRAKGCNCSVSRNGIAFAALDALVARVTDLEAALRDSSEGAAAFYDRAVAAEAQAAALTRDYASLQDALAAVTDECDEAREDARCVGEWLEEERGNREAAEAQVAALTEQRNQADAAFNVGHKNLLAMQVRAEAAEAALAEARQALTEIAARSEDYLFPGEVLEDNLAIARRALADTGGDTTLRPSNACLGREQTGDEGAGGDTKEHA